MTTAQNMPNFILFSPCLDPCYAFLEKIKTFPN